MLKSLSFFSFQLITLFLFNPFVSNAQDIILQPTSGKSIGSGIAYSVYATDANAIFNNSAGLAFFDNTKISTSIGNRNDATYFNISLASNFPMLDNVGLSVSRKNFSRNYNLDSTYTHKIREEETMISLASGYKLSDEFAVGFVSKFYNIFTSNIINDPFINSDDEATGQSTGFDIGVIYKPEAEFMGIKNGLTFGLNLKDIGPKIFFSEIAQAEPLPTTFNIAVSSKILDGNSVKATLLWGFQKILINRTGFDTIDPIPLSLITAWGNKYGISASLGADINLFKMISFRAGYTKQFNANSSNPDELSLGMGYNLKFFQFDAGYKYVLQTNPVLTNLLYITLATDFKLIN